MFDMSKFCFSLRGKRSEIQADLDQMPTVAPVSDRISSASARLERILELREDTEEDALLTEPETPPGPGVRR
eukprot:g33626.t1